MAIKTEITRADIMAMADYGRERKDRRTRLSALKKNRRMAVGPYASFYFENYDTMWHQVHEMLFIEQGGEAQIEGELRAYNPLIPNGRELVATVMFEIPDETLRRSILLQSQDEAPRSGEGLAEIFGVSGAFLGLGRI